MSAGSYAPAMWPMCNGPFAYGNAAVMRCRLGVVEFTCRSAADTIGAQVSLAPQSNDPATATESRRYDRDRTHGAFDHERGIAGRDRFGGKLGPEGAARPRHRTEEFPTGRDR